MDLFDEVWSEEVLFDGDVGVGGHKVRSPPDGRLQNALLPDQSEILRDLLLSPKGPRAAEATKPQLEWSERINYKSSGGPLVNDVRIHGLLLNPNFWVTAGEERDEESFVAAAKVGHKILLSLLSRLREKWESNGRTSTPLMELITRLDENCLYCQT